METFAKLFERFLVFVYHCFDRIVIQGYLPLLTRPEHIVHFFRDVHGQYPITPQVLAKRILEYRGWVEGYARNHKIPVLKAEKGVSKENAVRPHLQRMERRNQTGVYCFCGLSDETRRSTRARQKGLSNGMGCADLTTAAPFYPTGVIGTGLERRSPSLYRGNRSMAEQRGAFCSVLSN